MSTKITAIEYMFRLQGCFEDDTIYLFRITVHLRMYIQNRSCWRRGGFAIKENTFDNVKDLV